MHRAEFVPRVGGILDHGLQRFVGAARFREFGAQGCDLVGGLASKTQIVMLALRKRAQQINNIVLNVAPGALHGGRERSRFGPRVVAGNGDALGVADRCIAAGVAHRRLGCGWRRRRSALDEAVAPAVVAATRNVFELAAMGQGLEFGLHVGSDHRGGGAELSDRQHGRRGREGLFYGGAHAAAPIGVFRSMVAQTPNMWSIAARMAGHSSGLMAMQLSAPQFCLIVTNGPPASSVISTMVAISL